MLEKLGAGNKIVKKISCCNVYISGEEVFDCDRRLWQTYVLYHILKEANEFNVDQLTEYLRKEFDSCIESSLSIQFHRNDIPTLADVVRVYEL